MKELRLYRILVISLVTLNVGVMLFFWLTKPKHPPMGPRRHLVEELGIQGGNKKAVEELEKKHHEAKRELMEERHRKYEMLFEHIGEGDLNREKILREIAEIQYRIDKMTIEFFDKIAKLCTEEQREKLKDHVSHALPGPPPPPPHR